MKKFNKNTILDFGKHQNKTIKDLFDQSEYAYIYWMIDNIPGEYSDDIIIELEHLEQENNDIRNEFIYK